MPTIRFVTPEFRQSPLPDHIREDVQAVAGLPSVATLLEVICKTTGMGFAAVARVTDKYWVACAVQDNIGFGLHPGEELKLETTICESIQQLGEAVIISHVEKDPFYATHHTPAMYGFQSYISVPIRHSNGTFFGTLCAIDPAPRQIDTEDIRAMFTLFAQLIAYQLDSADAVGISESKLKSALAQGNLREQFIAILGHDLRNPVSAIAASAQLLKLEGLTGDAAQLIRIIENSVKRMKELIDNVLDFARGRLGEGLTIRREVMDPMQPLLQVINELKASSPDREIITQFHFSHPVFGDIHRIGQLLSNLLGNALTYGDRARPITVTATSNQLGFDLTVANHGPAIPEETKRRLFEPFSRGEVRSGQEGLGLGLYIASEIAKAHGGVLSVYSDSSVTSFSFRMPPPLQEMGFAPASVAPARD